MPRNCLGKTAIVLFIGIACLSVGLTSGAAMAADIQVTLGTPTTLVTSPTNINTDSTTVSRTGHVAVFYPNSETMTRAMRVSTDAGVTWGPEKYAQNHDGGAMEIGLREGGVLKFGGDLNPASHLPPDTYATAIFTWSDDFEYTGYFLTEVHVPNSQPFGDAIFPGASKGPIIQIPDGYSGEGVNPGDLLMPMHGSLTGDNWQRSYLVHSTDLGRTWDYRGSIAYLDADPYPETGGQWIGMAEPTITLLPNGQLLAVLRTQGDPYGPNNQFKPLFTAWSDDMGLTWTTPDRAQVKPGEGHDYLYSNSPTLAVLDNGVVALQYGRPGLHVAFSTDNGHTWGDILHLSELYTDPSMPGPSITGQFDMVKAGPNKLVVVGSDHNAYLNVWPITVDLEALAGDFDEDGDVDGVDFSIWQANNPTASGATRGTGDADGDGDVDGVDFDLWQENYPTAAPGALAGSTAIPEPATLGLLLAGGFILLRSRRR